MTVSIASKEDSTPPAPAVRKIKKSPWLLNGIIFVTSCSLLFLALEAGVRITGEDYQTHGLYNVSKNNRLRFISGSKGRYRTSEFDVEIKANRFGRRDREWDEQTLRDPENMLFIGDSMVLGYGLRDKETIPSLMESFGCEKKAAVETAGENPLVCRKREVLNFGMGGAVSIPEYRLLYNDAVKSHVAARDVVVGIFLGNDFSTSSVVAHPSFLERYSALYRWIERRLAASPRILSWIFSVGKTLGVNVYQSPESYLFLRNQREKETRLFNALLEELNSLKELSAQSGRRFYAVIFPTKIQVENSAQLSDERFAYDAPDRAILEFCKKNQIPCLDLLPVLKENNEKDGRPLFFPLDRHLNSDGAEVAARAIDQFLNPSQEAR